MGLIKAALDSVGSVFADQWKEYFYCDALPADVLIRRGWKRTSGYSSNKKGHDNIISNGSVISVADGQCMLIVEQGRIVEVSAEPGEFIFDSSTEPSIFTGPLSESILDSFRILGRRISYGSDTAKDQRVYYINIKELIGNKFGTPTPIPFRVVDRNLGLDIDVSVRCSGLYSYEIADPLKFYKSITGNITEEYLKEDIAPQLKSEFVSALQPAFAQLSSMEIRPNQMIAHTAELEGALNQVLSAKWSERGLRVVSVALSSVSLPEEDQKLIKDAQKTAMLRDPGMAAATLAGAQAEAMKAAAANENGAMNGFLGMGMAMNAGNGSNLGNLFAQAMQNKQTPPPPPSPAPANPHEASYSWTCSCGNVNTGKFCENCGLKKPETQKGWVCSCGHTNLGKFCSECGKKKPAEAPLYRCDKCGWEPLDPHHPPKFCPQCGDRFDDNDKK